jgi:hypothetical protein
LHQPALAAVVHAEYLARHKDSSGYNDECNPYSTYGNGTDDGNGGDDSVGPSPVPSPCSSPTPDLVGQAATRSSVSLNRVDSLSAMGRRLHIDDFDNNGEVCARKRVHYDAVLSMSVPFF